MLGTSTRTSDVLINLGLNPLRWLREVGSPQFGVLSARAPPSPRCTALTAASCENHGAAPNFGTRVPGNLGGNFYRPAFGIRNLSGFGKSSVMRLTWPAASSLLRAGGSLPPPSSKQEPNTTELTQACSTVV